MPQNTHDENGDPIVEVVEPTAEDYKNVTASDPSGEEAAITPPQS
jgi:hypothetical protein